MNTVIAGDYEGKPVVYNSKFVGISLTFTNILKLNKDTVESYEVITEEHRKSAVSGVSRGIVGGALLGPVGLLAGLSAKNKGTFNVAVQFRDGKRSLLEINDKAYKEIIKIMF